MASLVQQPLVMTCTEWDSYRLLDSGAGRKWESFGPHTFIRPEPQAMWQPRFDQWSAAGEFILDPPKFGRGPDGEVWRLEEHLPGLISDCARLLDKDSRFLFLTVYAVRMSSLAIAGLLQEALRGLPGPIEHGDLAVREEGEGGRLLPTAVFARWSNPV